MAFKRKMTYPESRLQASVVLNLRSRYPWVVFYHCPNGGRRSMQDAMRFKMMGVRPGVADLVFLKAAHGYHGLYLEMKSGKGSLSADQLLWEAHCVDEGYLYLCCDTVEQALSAVRWYYAVS